MPRRLGLLVASLLLLGLLPGPVSAGDPAGPGGTAAHHAKVLAYWTPARMKAAIPRDFVYTPAKGFQPAAKPGGGTSGAVTGASWTTGGKMLTATGRAWFTLGGTNYICSGSIVNDTNTGRSVVLTAGHCVVENDGTFATNWVFIPSFDTNPTYDCPSTTYGCWVADALYADAAFADAGSFGYEAITHDWAFAVVSGGGLDGGTQLDAAPRGSFPIQYTKDFKGKTLSAFGYPAAGKYHGSDLVYCKGTIGTDRFASNATWSMACDMTGGSSGGPWVESSASDYADATLSSLNSYGYSGVKNMYGPKFTTGTQTVFNAANGKAASATGVAVMTFR